MIIITIKKEFSKLKKNLSRREKTDSGKVVIQTEIVTKVNKTNAFFRCASFRTRDDENDSIEEKRKHHKFK